MYKGLQCLIKKKDCFIERHFYKANAFIHTVWLRSKKKIFHIQKMQYPCWYGHINTQNHIFEEIYVSPISLLYLEAQSVHNFVCREKILKKALTDGGNGGTVCPGLWSRFHALWASYWYFVITRDKKIQYSQYSKYSNRKKVLRLFMQIIERSMNNESS